ncbi:hypothetical protein XENTR_v10010051 [Xenopus tropicalis]|nr:hypothetical protein XENTR_v10010051 [Xenopus tropicalis]
MEVVVSVPISVLVLSSAAKVEEYAESMAGPCDGTANSLCLLGSIWDQTDDYLGRRTLEESMTGQKSPPPYCPIRVNFPVPLIPSHALP